jgi:MFS transporter, FSR family, fosmidomycin resistance protein
LIVVYNLLAFGTQVFFGLASDRFKSPKFFAMCGCAVTAASVVEVYSSPTVTVMLAGLGNAMFHVSGGTVSLNLTPKKATAPGIFVGPGAVGLAVGTLVGVGGSFVSWPFILLLTLSMLSIWVQDVPDIDYCRGSCKKIDSFVLALSLFLAVVSLRSFVGLTVALPWKTDYTLLAALTLAVASGKMLGGFLADRYGWTKVVVSASLASAPLLSFYNQTPQLALLGVFLFQMTMPVTLTAIANLLPGRPGFAFGLTCLALVAGGVVVYAGVKSINQCEMLALTVGSALALYMGLRGYRRYLITYDKGGNV